MGLKKGTAPRSFEEGKLDGYNLKNRSEEERKRISQLGVEARKKKKNDKMMLQKCLKQLLDMKLESGDKKRKILKEMGFEGEQATNSALLMTALFKKGLSGDVFAIREIVEMMDKLDMVSNGISDGNIVINVQPVKSKYEVDLEKAEEEIQKALDYELGEDDMDEW